MNARNSFLDDAHGGSTVNTPVPTPDSGDAGNETVTA